MEFRPYSFFIRIYAEAKHIYPEMVGRHYVRIYFVLWIFGLDAVSIISENVNDGK